MIVKSNGLTISLSWLFVDFPPLHSVSALVIGTMPDLFIILHPGVAPRTSRWESAIVRLRFINMLLKDPGKTFLETDFRHMSTTSNHLYRISYLAYPGH